MWQVKMEDCLSRGDSSDLVSVLHSEGLSISALSRLDQQVTKDLCGPGFRRVSVVLKSLEILSENRDDLETLVHHGLTAKLLSWSQAVHDLLTSDLQRNSSPLLSLTEEFYDLFLLLGQAPVPVSQLSVVLVQLARFALEPEIHFPLRLEAIRTFNSILESLNREQKKLIQRDQNKDQILSEMAAAVLTVGDYELQVSLSEALCRLSPRKVREQRANHWFSNRDISKAFCDIRDKDFEVDCRCFLNFVNRCHGDPKRVYSFPCLQAFLESMELFPPKDDKLEEFWIDFNLGSGCVSFFIDEPEAFLWGSVHLLKEEVSGYSLQVKPDGCTGAEAVLTVQLHNPIMHCNSRGHMVRLNFDSEHRRELEEAAGRVFTQNIRKSPGVKPPGDAVQVSQVSQVSPFAVRPDRRSYTRKKPQSKSQLKILPLSSPSSEEDSFVIKTPATSTSESLFDRIKSSTPSFDSGFLPDRSEGLSGFKRAEPLPEGEESNSPLTEEEEVGPPGEEVQPEEAEPEEQPPVGAGPEGAESKLTSGLTAAFNTFKTQLQQLFTDLWTNAESEALLSLKQCQQHVSSLLTAVHQHRLVLLQGFENSVSDQLTQMQENVSSLNTINIQIQDFFKSEMQRLDSFCDEHLQRLKSLESELSGTKHPSSQ